MPIIMVNGENRTLDEAKSIFQFLGEIGVDPKRVVVELNREIVPRAHLEDTIFKDGDVVEIVHFVGGG